MKSRIVLKVKHLVVILVTIFILLPLAAIFLVPQIEFGVVKHKQATGKNIGKEQVVKLLDNKLLPSQKYELIQEHMLADEWMDAYDIYVGPTMSTSIFTEENASFRWKEKKPYVADFFENGPLNDYFKTAAVALATEAARSGDEAAVYAIYEQAAKRLKRKDDPFLQGELALAFVRLYLQFGDYEKAESLLENMEIPEEQSYLQAEKTKWQVMQTLLEGEREEALATVREGLEWYEEAWKIEGNDDPVERSTVYEELKRLENRIIPIAHSIDGELAKVSGNISRTDGTPIAYAGLFLREASTVNHSIRPDEFYHVMTDRKGDFEFHNVVPGDYQIFVGFQVEQIDGYTWPVDLDDWITVEGSEEITYDVTLTPLMEVIEPANGTVVTEEDMDFRWEAVDGAAYYGLEFHIEMDGVSYGFGLDRRVEENHVTLPVEELYNLALLFIDDVEQVEEDYFQPESLLGFENPEGRYSWNVLAYDEDGNLLTRSDGYRLGRDTVGNLPILYLKQRELTEEDELVLDGKLEEALDGYLQKVDADPDDLHSLRMITRLIGLQADGDVEKIERLQLPYYERLAELTGDASYLYTIMHFYFGERDWETFQYWLEQAMEAGFYEYDPYLKGLHANALMYQGSYAEAAALHKEALELGSDNRNVGHLLALKILLDTDPDEVKELVKQYPYYEYTTGKEGLVDWRTIIHQVIEEIEQDEKARAPLKEGLEYFFMGDESAMEQWKRQTSKSVFIKFINMLEDYN